MNIKTVNPPIDLAIGKYATELDKEYLSGYKALVPGKTLVVSPAIDTTLGAWSGSPIWTSCLGSTTAHQTRSTPFWMYFPSYLRNKDDVERWCEFLVSSYNLAIHYAGEALIYGEYCGWKSSTQVRCHVICVESQDFHRLCPHALLTKVTLIRYLYKTDHYKKIIEPLYEMVDKGMNPWDALIMAHYAGFANKVSGYYADRGLMYDYGSGFTLCWPRSFDQMVAAFKSTGLLNGVWSGMTTSKVLFVSIESNLMANPYYHTAGRNFLFNSSFSQDLSYFLRPHTTVFKNVLFKELQEKNYIFAFEMYCAFIKEFEPLYLAIHNNPYIFNKVHFFGQKGTVVVSPATRVSITALSGHTVSLETILSHIKSL